MAEPQKDGAAYRAHLDKAAKMSGPIAAQARAELKGPPLPEACAYVWTWFIELNAARAAGFSGATPLGFPEIEAWARATGRQLRRLELQWIKALDAIWCGPAPREDG
jgi:hypothetical protein